MIRSQWDDMDRLLEWELDLPDELLPENTEPMDDGFEEPDPETVKTDIKPGDVITIGQHRLMCGDSTDEKQVATLLGGVTPDIVHNDPPYGMNAVTKSGVLSKRYKTDIMGDDDGTVAKDSFHVCQKLFPRSLQIWWGANYYSSALPDAEGWIVWDKNNGQSDQTDCELAWTNARTVVRQFTKASEKTNRLHPTQKPVALVSWIINRIHKADPQTIADLFGGSGVTMVTAHQIGATSYVMEYDPKFCQIIVDRMKRLDQSIKIERNGNPF